jgi:hypothetical protein
MGNDMKHHPVNQALGVRRGVQSALLASAGLLSLGAAGPAAAFDFSNEAGTVTGSWDTTLSYGQAWRTQSPDRRLIATANGGLAPFPGSGGLSRSPNIDDGNLNYLAGDTWSQAFKVTTELSVKYGDFGAFTRFSALYDYAVMDTDTNRTPISNDAEGLVGQYGRLLDAFVYGNFQLGENHPLELRIGKQIISWGESTFIQGGLTAINTVDVAALRVPGSELKEGFMPQQMVRATLGLTENTSVEGFYMFDWKRTEPEPVGSYFSTNDFVPRGGNRVILGFGGFSDAGVDYRPLGGPFITDFQNVPRDATKDPSESGQFGLAFRWFMPDLGSGTELGFYFMNYHSRLPLISGRTGTQAGVGNAVGTAVAVNAAAQAVAAGLPAAAAVNVGVAQGQARATAAGGNITNATLAQYATIGVNTLLSRGSQALVGAQASNLATHEYAKTAGYFTEYPEDQKVFGVSFNTSLGTTGVALQGELTYRQDVPLQWDDVEVLYAALTPFEQALFPVSAPGVPFPTTCSGPIQTLSRCGQVGLFGVNQVFQGWSEKDVWQFQTTATKAFPPMLGAQQAVLVAEVGGTSIPNLESKTSGGPNGRGLRYNGPGTSVSGNAELASRHCPDYPTTCASLQLVEPQNRFADDLSWGYRIAGRLDYPGLVGGWNVSPRASWQHDVNGTTPGPGGNFVEGRYAYTLGVSANLQQRWELDASYTVFGGAGRFNDINDRDFASASFKFSF